MKLHLALLSCLASVLLVLGSALTAQAQAIGLDFDLESAIATEQDRTDTALADRPLTTLHPTDTAIPAAAPPTTAIPDNSMLDFSVSGDELPSSAVNPDSVLQRPSVASTGKEKHNHPGIAVNHNMEQSSVVALRRAIIGQESGGKFDSINPHSGALGYGQLMPANVKAWGQETLGYAPSKQEFLKKPDLQLRIIDNKLNQYWQQEQQAAAGDEQTTVMRVASRWYSGNANLYTSTRPQYYRAKNGRRYRYPSISAYSWSVWRKYQKQQFAAVP